MAVRWFELVTFCKGSLLENFQVWPLLLRHQWRWKLENPEGEGDEKFGVKGGYPLENSSVLAHLFTASGQFCYFSWFFLFFCLFFFFLEFLGRTSPSLKILRRDTSPRFCRLWTAWRRKDLVAAFRHVKKILHPVYDLNTMNVRATRVSTFVCLSERPPIVPKSRWRTVQENMRPVVFTLLKAWSHECRISLRMTNECHFLASVDICRKCVSSSFDPLTGRSSLDNLRCLCVLLFSFVNVIRFTCFKSHSFLMRWPIRHYAALVSPGLYGYCTY